MPITIRKIELFVLSCFSLQHLSNVPKMPVFLSFFPKNRHFEMGSNCDVLTLKRTSFSTFFVVGRSNHLPTTSAFFRQIPSVAIYTKKLEINLAAMPRGFESHRLRQEQCLAGCCFWRRRWDSNPRGIAAKLISSFIAYTATDGICQ